MNAEELWTEFCKHSNIDITTPYEAWAFCGGGPDGDELADLVLARRKFGTATAYAEYALENNLEMIPKVGDYSVILKDNGNAVCVLKTYDMYIKPFNEVTPFHAYSEGEGDRTLETWRDIHKRAFSPLLIQNNLTLDGNTKIICEKLSLEYAPGLSLDPEDPLFLAPEELLFLEPSLTYENEINAYRHEMLEANSSFDGCFSLKRHESIAEYVEECTKWSNPISETNDSNTHVNVIMAVRKSDNKVIGFFQVISNPSEDMKKYTGFIGYSIRPSERKKGYAKKLLHKAIDFARCLGHDEILVTCLPDNEASRRTIIANGGRFKQTVYYEKDDINLDQYLL
jgi:predicted acetyltransferase/uncharacterized protein YhfF